MNMSVNTETKINLKTLQRVDSSIYEIIDTASQVAIYKYERKLNKWESTDIEGTLFLYKRSIYPFHGFIIVNRMSTANFVEAITSDMDILLQEPYFLYKKNSGEIIGSWFYEHKDFRRITNKIQSIVLKQAPIPRRQRCSSDSDSRLKKNEAVHDIMTLLSEAHAEYIKTEKNNLNDESSVKKYNCLVTDQNHSTNMSEKRICGFDKHDIKKENPVHQHRLFLSSKSCDPSCSQPSFDFLKMLVNNPDNFSPPTNLRMFILPQSNPNSESSVMSPGKMMSLKETEEFNHFKVNCKMEMKHNFHSDSRSISDDSYDFKTDDVKRIFHSMPLKVSLLSHLEDDSDILFKIHEAYISSLKSIFT